VNFRSFPATERETMVERICDYFAGCLLMPRPWVKRLYGDGLQQLDQLAASFGVSQAAMAVRLSQIGLTEPTPRCLPPNHEWTFQSIRELAARPTYRRPASPVTT
jgi:Zn-dependent peptidase ImmA (M78 family)